MGIKDGEWHATQVPSWTWTLHSKPPRPSGRPKKWFIFSIFAKRLFWLIYSFLVGPYEGKDLAFGLRLELDWGCDGQKVDLGNRDYVIGSPGSEYSTHCTVHPNLSYCKSSGCNDNKRVQTVSIGSALMDNKLYAHVVLVNMCTFRCECLPVWRAG